MMTVGEHAPEDNGCPPPSDGSDVWIFAYGSLMWDPGFPYEEARPAVLKGYHRALCLYSTRYRGTPEKPGLVLGLDRGGACRGIGYRVAALAIEVRVNVLRERATEGFVMFALADLHGVAPLGRRRSP